MNTKNAAAAAFFVFIIYRQQNTAEKYPDKA